MRHVFKVGPVVTGEGHFTAYTVATEGSLSPVDAQRDEDALRALTRSGAADLICEPAMAKAAGALSLPVGELPRPIAEAKAALALLLAHGPMFESFPAPHLLLSLIEAADAFEAAEPWSAFDADTPLSLSVSGAVEATFEVSVLGRAGEALGAALHPEPGSVARVAALVSSGKLDEAATVPFFSLSLEEGPAYAREALEEISELASVPILMRVERGHPAPVGSLELRVLTAALRAIVDKCNGGPGAGECKLEPALWAKLRLCVSNA